MRVSGLTDELYARQKLIEGLHPPNKALVLGVGGVGSYVALFLTMVGVREITVVDPDVVEESNRSRVMFRPEHVGMSKVDAVYELMKALRTDVSIKTYNCKVEDIPEYEHEAVSRGSLLFDCRDNVERLPEWLPQCIITGGYDGLTVTLDKNPKLDNVFGDETVFYRVTPSFCVPPIFLASMITLYASMPELHTEGHQFGTFDLRDLVKTILKGGIKDERTTEKCTSSCCSCKTEEGCTTKKP